MWTKKRLLIADETFPSVISHTVALPAESGNHWFRNDLWFTQCLHPRHWFRSAFGGYLFISFEIIFFHSVFTAVVLLFSGIFVWFYSVLRRVLMYSENFAKKKYKSRQKQEQYSSWTGNEIRYLQFFRISLTVGCEQPFVNDIVEQLFLPFQMFPSLFWSCLGNSFLPTLSWKSLPSCCLQVDVCL